MALAGSSDGWEIVAVDSMQVYRGMDVGTAKPTAGDQDRVPHHCLDLAEPWEDFDLATYQSAAKAAIAGIEQRGRRALLVGGTALYLRAVVDDLTLPGQYPAIRAELEADDDTEMLHRRLVALDPDAARRMEPTNRRRVVRALEVTVGSGRPFSSYGPGLDDHPATSFRMVGLAWPRDLLDRRIQARLQQQLEDGLVAEVAGLVASPRPLSRSAGQALGYKELAAHVRDGESLDESVDLTLRRTRRFSRRQEKWFRRDPRIEWIDMTSSESVAERVDRLAVE